MKIRPKNRLREELERLREEHPDSEIPMVPLMSVGYNGTAEHQVIYLFGNGEDVEEWARVLFHEILHQVFYEMEIPLEAHHHFTGLLGVQGARCNHPVGRV